MTTTEELLNLYQDFKAFQNWIKSVHFMDDEDQFAEFLTHRSETQTDSDD